MSALFVLFLWYLKWDFSSKIAVQISKSGRWLQSSWDKWESILWPKSMQGRKNFYTCRPSTHAVELRPKSPLQNHLQLTKRIPGGRGERRPSPWCRLLFYLVWKEADSSTVSYGPNALPKAEKQMWSVLLWRGVVLKDWRQGGRMGQQQGVVDGLCVLAGAQDGLPLQQKVL